jgi:hypothetical protein
MINREIVMAERNIYKRVGFKEAASSFNLSVSKKPDWNKGLRFRTNSDNGKYQNVS